MKLFINSHTSTAEPLKSGNGYVISFHTLQVIFFYLSMFGLKLNRIRERGPSGPFY